MEACEMFERGMRISGALTFEEGPDVQVGSGRVYIEDDDGKLSSFDIDDPHELGRLGEELAARYLEACGWQIEARNWRCPQGEVDIVARDGEAVTLVEVKTRRSRTAVPEIAVDERKRERYRRLSLRYLAEHPDLPALRFDVVAVTVPGPRDARIRHLMGACSWDS